MTATAILFDPRDPEVRQDPYPAYRRMQAEAPVWRSPDGIWYFTRYQDCVDLMRSPALSYDSTASRTYQAGLSTDPEQRAHQVSETQKNRSLLDVDPPEHTRLRSLINRAFTAPVVEASRPTIVEYVDSLMEQFAGAEVDLVSEYGSLLPIMVICRMMGVEPDNRRDFLEVGNAVARSIDPDVPVPDKLAANARMRQYIAGLVGSRRSDPGEDLITRLVEATEDGRLVSEDELIINTGILLIAGFETTTNLITNAVYRLLQDPELLEAYRADPSLDGSCIEEVLRYDPPTHFMRARTIIADTEIGGAGLHPGDPVVPLLAAANRDPDEFPEPDTFDMTRRVNRHLSFGVGHHLCIGASLARLEGQIALRRLLERFPKIQLAPHKRPEHRPNLQLRGFSTLPVVVA